MNETPPVGKACQSCRRRQATQYVRTARGAKQCRCDHCVAKKNRSGFTKGAKES